MKISVLTATKNRAPVLGAALESLNAQSHSDWEHLVQDGGTDAATDALLHRYEDARRLVIRAPDSSLYDALNKATERATGDVVGVLSSDDVLAEPDVLTQVAEAFAQSDIQAIYGDLDYISAHSQSRRLRHWRAGGYCKSRLARGWMPPHPTLFVRRAILDAVGPYDTRFQISADYDLILRLFHQPDMRAHYIPRVLVRMRSGGLSNGTIRKFARRAQEDLQVLRKNGMGGHGTLAMKVLRKLPQLKI